jgi:hypothetical protein
VTDSSFTVDQNPNVSTTSAMQVEKLEISNTEECFFQQLAHSGRKSTMRRETEIFKKKVNFKNYKAVKLCEDFEQ